MRCPKCGAFMGEGTDVCFMCGTNVKTYNPNMPNNGYYGQQGGSSFPGLNDYDNIYNNVKNGDKDVFDFFSDHKLLIRFLTFVLILGAIFLTGLIYYRVKTKAVKVKPVIGQLYYKVNDVFKANGEGTYSLSGEKGSACNITISVDSNSSADHVSNLFKNLKDALEPDRDNKQVVIDRKEIYTSQEGSIDINGGKWYYLNVFYPEKDGGTANILKYRFLTSINNGFAYNIELKNNSNEAQCSAALDDFVRSFQFLEETAEKK
jgi:hypothetical protein